MSFVDWLHRIATLYKLLAAAIAAVMGLLAPQRLIPEPLDPFRVLVSIIVVVAFVLTWTWRDLLRRHVRWVAAGAFGLLVVLVVLNVLYVRQIEYQNPDEIVQVLVGPQVTNSDLLGIGDEEVIKMVGVGWGELEQAYGKGFTTVALSYALVYFLLATGIILALGGSQLAKPSKSPNSDSEPKNDAQ